MPELPDVEGFRRVFARRAAGRRVQRVRADASMLRGTSPQQLGRALKGRRFRSPRRHGKLLACPTDGAILLLHFGMTGLLVWSQDARGRHPHDRLILAFDGGELRYRNMRKFGGVWLVYDERELESILDRLGPDWLDVTRRRLDVLLDRRRGSIKAALMDQALAAGLGNLTADEALWQARIDPRRPAASLDAGERDRLHRKVRKVLRDSIPHGLVPGKRTWLTGARDGKNSTCPRCGERLARTRIGGRTTVYCPAEQS